MHDNDAFLQLALRTLNRFARMSSIMLLLDAREHWRTPSYCLLANKRLQVDKCVSKSMSESIGNN
jgi:hypothetical protein